MIVDKKFVKRCDTTGCGMNQGYVCNDGEFYFSTKEHLLDHLRTLNWEDCNGVNSSTLTNDEDIMEFFYNEDYYCYTEWTEYDINDEYYDEEGNRYEV